MRRQTARMVQFIWSPLFLKARTASSPHSGEHQPHAGRVA
jgi:hypothetical protein